MTILANCREKFMKDAYPHGTRFQRSSEFEEGEINPYWEGNLKGANKATIQGYDWARIEIDSFFENSIDELMSERLGEYLANKIDMEVMIDQRPIDEFSEEEIAKMSKETYLLKAIHSELNKMIEVTRNEMITALIDGQDDKE